MEWAVRRYDRVTSTMDVAAQLAAEGEPAGTVVVAEEQSAGRGRLGRVWLAPPGTCLLMTVLLRPPLEVARMSDLSRRIAEQVARAVAEVAGITAVIKDPNDLLVRGKKLSGILAQTSIRGDVLEYLLIGIGLNVNVRSQDMPLERATSLLVETGVPHDREQLLVAILDRLSGVPLLLDSGQEPSELALRRYYQLP